MVAKVVGTIGLLVAAVVLAISLLMLPGTFALLPIAELAGPLARGQFRLMALAGLICALAFGLAFGAIVVRHVGLKSLVVSFAAGSLVILFTGALASLNSSYAKANFVECGVFLALFWFFAMAGSWLFRRLPQGPRIAAGSFGFVALFALLIAVPFFEAISKAAAPLTPEARLERAQQQIRSSTSDIERFYALNDAAKQSFVLGHIDDARQFAEDLLRIAEQCRGDWNYGNAIHDGNLVLGRIAVREGRIEDAKLFLIKAGATPGSPQLDSFGPNMTLAKDLLERGERDVVLQYFDLCRKFWETNHGTLDAWSKEVRAGKTPEFGANLVY